MKRLSLALAASLAVSSLADAQTYKDTGNTIPQVFVPLVGCPNGGGTCSGPVSATNPFPVSGTFSATLSGFAPGSAYATPLSVSSTSSRVALPSGTVVVVYNTGSNPAFVQLGNSSVAATTSADVVPAGGWMAFTAGSNTYLAAITSSGTTSVNISGGTGLPTGSGGGSGGGGSIPTGSAGSPSASVISVQGVSGGTVVPVTVSNLPLTQTVDILTSGTLYAALQSGVATPGSAAPSNGLYIGGRNASGNFTPFLLDGSSGVYIGGEGVAGTPSGGVLSVQGVSGGTGLPVTGTFWQTTQPVSIASLPLPSGAATAAAQTSVESSPGTGQTTAVTIQGNSSGIAVPVSGTVTVSNLLATQPVSATSLPLPTGAATASNQTAVQSAPGTAQTVAETVQGNPASLPVPVGPATAANGGDPCFGALKSSTFFSSATAQFQFIAGTASKKTYICHLDYRVSAATAVSVIEGTGTNCGTGGAAMDGSLTAASGKSEAANGGEAAGSGAGDIMHTATAADSVCFLQSGTATIAGRVTYVQQ